MVYDLLLRDSDRRDSVDIRALDRVLASSIFKSLSFFLRLQL